MYLIRLEPICQPNRKSVNYIVTGYQHEGARLFVLSNLFILFRALTQRLLTSLVI